MPKVATRELTINIGDYYEVGGLRYTLQGKNPLRFVAARPTTDIETWIANEGNAHTAGQKLKTGDSRRMVLGAVAVQINYRGDDTDSCPALSVDELLYWEYIGQSSIPTIYPGAGLAIKGYQYRHSNGQLLQVRANANLAATFDATQWQPVAEGRVVREVVGGSVDALALLDAPENFFTLNGVTVSNGPGNAAQNVSGNIYTAGDGKNGVVTLTVISGNNVGAIGGTWFRRVTTPEPTVAVPNPPTDTGAWARTPLTVALIDSVNNGDVFTGSSISWDLNHTIKPAFTVNGPIVLTPKTDWSTRTGTLSIQSGTLIGSLPTHGTEPIELVYSPSPISWTIKTKPPTVQTGKTIHNFGLVDAIVLKGVDDNLGEAHIEGGSGYSIAAADWFDGMSIRFTHTAGQNTEERLKVSGFAGAYLRNGTSRNISDGMFIGRQDCKFTVTITENGGQKYLNIDDTSPDAFAIWAYPPTPPPNQKYHPTAWIQKLVSLAGTEMVKANAIAPNAVAATHFVDAWDDMLTPLYGDGKIFTLPAAISAANPAIGSLLYLGAAGGFSLTPPDVTVADNIRQPVAIVMQGGKGRIRLLEASRVLA